MPSQSVFLSVPVSSCLGSAGQSDAFSAQTRRSDHVPCIRITPGPVLMQAASWGTVPRAQKQLTPRCSTAAAGRARSGRL